MKTIRITWVAAILLFFLALGCKRPVELGPELAVASSNFQMTSPLKAKFSSLSFYNKKNFFTAKFNERVSWNLTIKGLTSHAFKNYSGIGDYLDSSLTVWDGSTNGKGSEVNLFYKEKAVAYLEIFGLDKVLTDTVTITRVKNLSDHAIINRGATIFVDWSVVLADYETSSSINGTWHAPELFDNAYYNDKQIEFGQGTSTKYSYYFSLPTSKQDLYEQRRDNILDAPQGTNYLVIKAFDTNKDYYVTNFGFNRGGAEPMFGNTLAKDYKYFPNPDSLYLNFFLYGNGGGTKTILGVNFTEQTIATKPGGATLLETFSIDIIPDHVGWKYFSIKYSDINVAVPTYITSDPYYPKGYVAKKEGDQILSIGFNIKVKDAEGDPFDLIMDYPCVTYGKPLLDPNE
jgi:hypothetical protein